MARVVWGFNAIDSVRHMNGSTSFSRPNRQFLNLERLFTLLRFMDWKISSNNFNLVCLICSRVMLDKVSCLAWLVAQTILSVTASLMCRTDWSSTVNFGPFCWVCQWVNGSSDTISMEKTCWARCIACYMERQWGVSCLILPLSVHRVCSFCIFIPSCQLICACASQTQARPCFFTFWNSERTYRASPFTYPAIQSRSLCGRETVEMGIIWKF